MQYSEQRASGRVIHVELPPGIVTILPDCMVDASVCAGMALGAARISMDALRDRRLLLLERGFGRSFCDVSPVVLGFDVSEPTVSRYLHGLKRRADLEKAKRWLAFLHNHRELVAALDLFTVPTLTFCVLYGFFVIEHRRRRILHFNATGHPASDWIVQQLREALTAPFSLSCARRGDHYRVKSGKEEW